MSTAQSEPSKVFQCKSASIKTKKRKSKLTKQQMQRELQKESTLLSARLRPRIHSETCFKAQETQTVESKRRKTATRMSKIKKDGAYLAHQMQETDIYEQTTTPSFLSKIKKDAACSAHEMQETGIYEHTTTPSFCKDRLFSNPPHYFSSTSSYSPESYRNDSYLPSSYHVLYHYHHHHHHGFEKPPNYGLHRSPYNHRNGRKCIVIIH